MRLQTKALDPRSAHSPSRTAGRESRELPLRRPAGGRRSAIRPGRQCASVQGQSRLQPRPDHRSGRPERSTPLIPLTLRGMHRLRRPRCSSARPSFSLLSVLALLALASFPALAHAGSEIPEYETEIPTSTGHKPPPVQGNTHPGGGTEPGANTSSSPGGSNSNTSGSTETPESESSPGGSSSGGNNNSSTGSGGGTGQGNGGNGPTAQESGSSVGGEQEVSNSTNSSSSSPLVPILIAVAVLAAISIGAVVIRQRRQRGGSGGEVSPKAS